MATTDEDGDGNQLAELAGLAADLGPALAPAGHEEFLQKLVELARSTFDAAACSIAVVDEDEETLTFRAAAGAGADEIVGTQMEVGRGIAGWVVASGQSATVEEPAQDPRFAADVAAATGFVPRVIHAVPLETEARMVGVLEILDPGEAAPGGSRGTAIMTLVAGVAALAIEAAEVFSQLGRFLLGTFAEVAEGDTARALTEAAERARGPEADLAAVARLLHELGRLGTKERRVAVAVLSEFVAYARARGPSS